jgi:hypothetical protein
VFGDPIPGVHKECFLSYQGMFCTELLFGRSGHRFRTRKWDQQANLERFPIPPVAKRSSYFPAQN